MITEWSQCSFGHQKHCFTFSWYLLLLEVLTTTRSETSFFQKESLFLLCGPAQNTKLQTHLRGLHYLANHLSVQLPYVHLSTPLSVHPSIIHPSIHPLSIHQPIHHLSQSIYPSIHLSLYISTHPSIPLSFNHPSISPSVYHSTIHLSLCPSTHLST